MKKLMIAACSAMIMGICSLAQAQVQDSSSTDLNTPQPVEQSQQQNNTQSDDMKTQDAERVDETQSTDQQLQQDADALKQNFEGSTIDKVGPNGEQLFMERGKYFYMDENGKKVKVKKSEVKDKSEMQQQ